MKSVMVGKILEYEAKTIRNEGLEQGIQQGMEQGMQQGIQQGMEQGVEQGRMESTLKSIRSLMKKKGWSANEAMEALDISPDDRIAIAAQL